MLWCDIHSKTVRVTANITGGKSGKAVISAESFNSEKNHTPEIQSFEYTNGKLDALYKMATIACFGVSMSLISTG